MHKGTFSLAIVGLFLALPGTAHAQDALENIIKSKDISRTQAATMEAEVALRFRRLTGAKSIDSRAEARDRITKTAQIPGASPAGLATYARTCANEAAGLVSSDTLDRATDGVMVLSALDHPETADTLADALKSSHAAVRLMAARVIVQLHDKLKDDSARCRSLLSALGRAGAAEQDGIALRVIYQAIDFKANAASFKSGAESADALATVLAARISKLEAGGRDEMNEEIAIDAAVRCYPDASKATQSKLISLMSRLLAVGIERFFATDTAADYLPTLDRFLGRVDDAIRKMAEASSANSLKNCPKLKLSPRSVTSSKHQEEAMKVLDCVSAAIAGDPWNAK